MTAEEVLDRWAERAAAATGGPWLYYDEHAIIDGATPWWMVGQDLDTGEWIGGMADAGTEADAAFIAHARTDLPIAVEALRAILALHAREQAMRQAGHGDNAEGIWLCAGCLSEYPCETRRTITDHLTGAHDD